MVSAMKAIKTGVLQKKAEVCRFRAAIRKYFAKRVAFGLRPDEGVSQQRKF